MSFCSSGIWGIIVLVVVLVLEVFALGALPFTEEALLTRNRIPHAGYVSVLCFDSSSRGEDDDEYEYDLYGESDHLLKPTVAPIPVNLQGTN
jgi:hypothetical protein